MLGIENINNDLSRIDSWAIANSLTLRFEFTVPPIVLGNVAIPYTNFVTIYSWHYPKLYSYSKRILLQRYGGRWSSYSLLSCAVLLEYYMRCEMVTLLLLPILTYCDIIFSSAFRLPLQTCAFPCF